MAGYSDTRQLIIDTLMGRPAGTEIQPEDHQAFALALNDYIRSVELVAGSGIPVAFAEPNTVPVQPNNGQAVYLSSVGGAQTVVFSNFIDQNGNAISVTSTANVIKLVTLLWNGRYWSSQVVSVNAVRDTTNGFLFMGVATPDTNPGVPESPEFYLATDPGQYVNFNNLTLLSGESAFLIWKNETWAKELVCHGTKPVEWQSGFILPSGGNLSVNSHPDIRCSLLNCTEGQEFYISYCKCTDYVPAWCFVDKNNAVISQYDGGEVAIVNSVVVVPAGAVKVIFNSFFYSNAQGEVSYWPSNSVENLLRERISEIETRQDGLEGEFDTISASVEQNTSLIGRKSTIKLLTTADYSGLVYDGSKFVKSNTYYNSFIIPLKEGEYFRVITAGDVTTIPNGFVFEEVPSLGEQPYVNRYYNAQLANGFYPSEQQKFIVLNIEISNYTDGFLSYPIPASGLCKEIEILQEQGPTLLGKTILCLGDSITEFKYQGKGYCDYLADITGATVINGGIGGAQMGRRAYISTPLELEYAEAYACLDLPSLAEAISTGDFTKQIAAANWLATNTSDNNTKIINSLEAVDISKVDIITIFIGTNDIGSPLGELGEVGNSSGTLNCSKGFQWAIQNLLTANPKLRIYYFCPMPRYFGDLREAWDEAKWCDNYESNGIKFIDMVDFQIELAKYYKIPVCDMYRTMGINQWNIKSIMNSSTGDGVHPYLGFRMIANKIASFIIANNNLNN